MSVVAARRGLCAAEDVDELQRLVQVPERGVEAALVCPRPTLVTRCSPKHSELRGGKLIHALAGLGPRSAPAHSRIREWTEPTTCGRFWTGNPSGVSVAAVDVGGQRLEVTIGTLLSLSLDPPRVGFTISMEAAMHELLHVAGGCSVSLLAASEN